MIKIEHVKSLKTKERIGTGLYIIAIILLMISIFKMGANEENEFIRFAGYGALIVASIYAIWLSSEKKKLNDNQSE